MSTAHAEHHADKCAAEPGVPGTEAVVIPAPPPPRTEAVREGLRLLHRRARHAALAREYGEFYGGAEAPISDVTALGDVVAADTMSNESDS